MVFLELDCERKELSTEDCKKLQSPVSIEDTLRHGESWWVDLHSIEERGEDGMEIFFPL
jgi:hypothetical protein